MQTLNDTYNESKKYSNTIISSIKKILDKKKISYTENSNGSELIITNTKKTKKTISKLLNTELDVPESVFNLLIKITELNNAIYIRQVTK